MSFSRQFVAVSLLAGFLLLVGSCSGDYCIQCIDPTGARPVVEGCDDNLNGLESSRAAYEAEGFVCVIFEN